MYNLKQFRATRSQSVYYSLVVAIAFVVFFGHLGILRSRSKMPSVQQSTIIEYHASTPTKKRISLPTSCKKRVFNYQPSAMEKSWARAIAELAAEDKSWKKGCAKVRAEAEKIHLLLREIQQHTSGVSGRNMSYTHLSSHEVEDSCTGVKSIVYVEPLISFLRHPQALCINTGPDIYSGNWIHKLLLRRHAWTKNVFDKSYMVVPFVDEVSTHDAYKWLFDAGASTYDAGAGGASQSWFVDTYRKRGIEFDRIIGWEAALTDPRKQWSTVPADIKRKTSWYNIPATAIKGDPDNPLTFIKELVSVEDYVVFKLDIDTPAVEVALVQQLMKDEELLELIDEFYFEHHVSGSPMQWHGWGDLTKSKTALGHIQNSYDIFTFFRQRGIRAHSWV